MAFGAMIPQDRKAILLHGVRSGRLNKGEFRTLNAMRNEIAGLRAQLGPSNGIGLAESAKQMQLAAAERRYTQMQNKFLTKDVFIPSNGQSQTDKFFDGIKSGEITDREAIGYMGEERRMAAKPGDKSTKSRSHRAHTAHLEWISNNDQKMPPSGRLAPTKKPPLNKTHKPAVPSPVTPHGLKPRFPLGPTPPPRSYGVG